MQGKPAYIPGHLSHQRITDMVTSAECLALREWDGVKNWSGQIKMSIPK